MSRWRRRLVVTGALLCAFLGVAYFFSSLFLPASARPRLVRVEIPTGASASQIADILATHELIRSRYAFVLLSRLLGEAKNMKAGDYDLDAHDGLFQIIDKLAQGQAVVHLVSIPEGYTINQIASVIEQRRIADARVFLEDCRSDSRRFPALDIPRPSLEGYLMPDTYRFKNGISEEEIIRMLTDNFRKRVMRDLAEPIRASGRPLDEIIIVASLIEREARIPDDRDKISAVIRNRLRKSMRLQIDATVQYALGRHKSQLSLGDTRVEHPYNTYRHAGLPPGPICNPGIDCILAALRPAKVNYLYYVAQRDGSHYFSTTYDEHKRHGGT
jgi:UPF0755 protein